MKISLKYNVVALSFSLLVGCGSMNPLPEEMLIASETTIKEPVKNNNTLLQPSSGESKNSELEKEISNDYLKRLMVLDMECGSSLLEYSKNIEPPYVDFSRLNKMQSDGEVVIEDLANRLNANPSADLKIAYEQEIARLKLEYLIEYYQQSIESVENQRSVQLDNISNKESLIYKCSVDKAEATAEKDRLLKLVDLSSEVEKVFAPTINELTDKLREAEIELDMVNQEAFDDLMF